MSRPRSPRGTTLVEAMIALVVLLIGAIGVIAAHRQGLQLNSDARRVTRASAVAQDLVDQIALWPYADPRLANTNTANDADLGDTGFALESATSVSSLVDHGDSDLTLGGTTWQGIPTGVIQSFSPPLERYWNVAYVDDLEGDGVYDAVRVAVVVRWCTAPGSCRRIVSFTVKPNPRPVTP